MMRMMNGPDDFVGPVNIGTQFEYTILELAEMIIKMTGSKSKIVHKSLPKNDPVQRRPDTTLAETKLGWKPKVSLEEGLQRTIDYFRNEIHSE
jgi:UDP-glucuronate decarboxylase